MKRNSKDVAQKCATPRISKLHVGEMQGISPHKLKYLKACKLCLEVFCD